MDPVVLSDLIHDYFEGLCAAVEAEGGMVAEFIGDAILALFGAPQAQSDHADRAVAAALAIDAFASRFSALQHGRGIPFGITRIGVHCGFAMVGNIGTRKRLKYGALGDLLNTGSRLEGLNKVIGTRICVSGDVAREAARYRFRAIGSFVVKGRHEAIEVCEPVDPRFHQPDRIARYEEVVELLRAGHTDAPALLAALHDEDPEDVVVAFHRKRLNAGDGGMLIVMLEK
jgi:adenylate cyclase